MANPTISQPVGKGQANMPDDVRVVQQLLNQHTSVTGQTLEENGIYDLHTLAAITAYQAVVGKMKVPDGVISPDGPTFADLVSSSPLLPNSVAWLGAQQPAPPSVLGPEDFARAAATLGCESAAIRAVAAVETGPQGAFDDQGRPTILFERHIFSRLTSGVYDAEYPDISNPQQGGYGKFSEQYNRLQRAAALNEEAALKSASWGAFQIMGMNCDCTGSDAVLTFVSSMRTGIQAHLDAFVSFIHSDPTKTKAIQAKNWPAFAKCYNGANYKVNNYDVKLQTAYQQFVNA